VICWDVGGCDKIRPLWRHYFTDLQGIVFVVDSNDLERIENVQEELRMILDEEGAKGKPLLMLANKQDLPRALSCHEIAEKLQMQQILERTWLIAPTCAVATLQESGLIAAFAWLEEQMQPSRGTSPLLVPQSIRSSEYLPQSPEKQPLSPPIPSFSYAPSAEHRVLIDAHLQTQRAEERERVLAQWESREDCEEDVFLEQLRTCSLDVWDHYVHVRIAWLCIARHGVEEGFERVEQALRAFIASGARTNGKSFHRTMTWFWSHMVAWGIERIGSSGSGSGSERTDFKGFVASLRRRNDSLYPSSSSSSSSFPPFLDLWDKSFFERFYSREVMFGADAKESIVQPDLQSLPALTGPASSSDSSYWRRRDQGTPML
jgi:GTPase SAR1 family protein